MKKKRLRWMRYGSLLGIAALIFFGHPAAASESSLGAVQEEAQILPIGDSSGNLLMKSDGYYCMTPAGALDPRVGVHYFDHFVIGGTVLDGFYYHDESGKFKAGNPHLVAIQNQVVPKDGENFTFQGIYMVGNLGKLTAAPQVRLLENVTIGNTTFDGYYYFNAYGRLVQDPGVYEVHNAAGDREFDGWYYFGGTNAALVNGQGVTPDGLAYDADGKLSDSIGADTLEPQIVHTLDSAAGEWSVYLKNLDTDAEIVVDAQPMFSASLIKVFVMAKTYADLEEVQKNEAALLNLPEDSPEVHKKVERLLYDMITVSDNESFNELVRLQSETHAFKDGAEKINQYLKDQKFLDTTVAHTLAPSSSPDEGLDDLYNMTSVVDCGALLEAIYNRECVSPEASVEMMNLLLEQQTTYKIPEGVPSNVVTASKSGENDQTQNDIAIVFGEKADYILCVMCNNYENEGDAITEIQNLSRTVYQYLNR